MDVITFLKTVLPDDGWYCSFGLKKKEGKKKPVPIQKFYNSVDLLSGASRQFDLNGMDAYFALSTYITDRSREVDNVKYVKSLFLDIDCGEGKPYKTQKYGVMALKKFCQENKLPKPLLVNSGRGIHAYWPLTEKVPYDSWLVVAERFKQMCIRHGLHIDPAVPADAARVLRTPETHNHKDDPPKNVIIFGGGEYEATSLERFSDLIGNVVVPFKPPVILKGSSLANSALMDNLSGNIKGSFKKLLERTARGTGCSQIGIIATDQTNIDEPLWRAGLSIAKFCEDSDKAARLISSKHPDYSEDETYNKLDLIKGPYLCSRFNEYNPGICEDCSHWGKIKSPIVLTKEFIEPDEDDYVVVSAPPPVEAAGEKASNEIIIPHFPKPYYRGKHGGVYMLFRDDQGEEGHLCICPHDFYVVGRVFDPNDGECAVLRVHLPHDPVREFNVPLHGLTSPDEFRKAVSREGIMILSHEVRPLMTYIQGWVMELQHRSSALRARRQYGWFNDNKSFVLGNREYVRNSPPIVNHPSATTFQSFEYFQPRGTLEGWKDMISFYNREGLEAHQLVVISSFASILLQMIPNIAGCGLNVYHKDSGYGKTTAMLAGASAWGRPQDLVSTAQSTKNAQMLRAELMKNLPLYIDELTNMDPEELSDLYLQVASADGKQKDRMASGSNVARVRGEPWSLFLITTSNTSALERIAMYKDTPKAEAQRVLELIATQYHGFRNASETTDFNAKIEENYGLAGPIALQFVLDNFAEVEEMVRDTKLEVDEEYGLTHVNRFWSAFVTCNIVMAEILINLGLIPYDINRLKSFTRKLVETNKNGYAHSTKCAEETIVDFINENYNNILYINSGSDLFDNASLSKFQPSTIPRGPLVARYETDINKLYIVTKPLKKWCARQQINYGNLIAELEDRMGAITKSVRLHRGTNIQAPSSRVVILDFDLDLEQLQDDAVDDEPERLQD